MKKALYRSLSTALAAIMLSLAPAMAFASSDQPGVSADQRFEQRLSPSHTVFQNFLIASDPVPRCIPGNIGQPNPTDKIAAGFESRTQIVQNPTIVGPIVIYPLNKFVSIQKDEELTRLRESPIELRILVNKMQIVVVAGELKDE